MPERQVQFMRLTMATIIAVCWGSICGAAETNLKADIESATERGVAVVLKLYRPMELPTATIVVNAKSSKVLERWPGVWANGVFDGKRHLLSLTSRDQRHVHYAIWSTNPYVSWVYHSSLVQELLLVAAEAPPRQDGSLAARIEATCSSSPPDRPTIPGYDLLLSRLTDYETVSTGKVPDAKHPAQHK
jgi:hypothetical protein